MKKLNIEFQELPYAVEEAMNRLRINIKFCGKNTRKILITSSMPNEGKSSVAINLWKMLAEAGSGHPGGSLSAADILATLFFSDLLKSGKKAIYRFCNQSAVKGIW